MDRSVICYVIKLRSKNFNVSNVYNQVCVQFLLEQHEWTCTHKMVSFLTINLMGDRYQAVDAAYLITSSVD